MIINSTENFQTGNNLNNNSTIYKKIQKGKRYFLNSKLTKSGKNNYQKYSYFELKDIEPILLDFCEQENLTTRFNLSATAAILIIRDEDTKEEVHYTLPLPEVTTQDARKAMQEIGSLQTYAMRYLYMQVFEIVVCDGIENNNVPPKKTQSQNKSNYTTYKPKIINTDKAESPNQTKLIPEHQKEKSEPKHESIEDIVTNIQAELKHAGEITSPARVIEKACERYGKDSNEYKEIRKVYHDLEQKYTHYKTY